MKTLDTIIMQRQSTRVFTDEVPEKALIEAIVESGRLAPYAGIVQQRRDSFRHFFAVSRTNPIMVPLFSFAHLFIIQPTIVVVVQERPRPSKHPPI